MIMKRALLIITALLLLLSVVSCEAENPPKSQPSEIVSKTAQAENPDDNVKLTVQKSLLAEPEKFSENMRGYGAEVEEDTDAQEYVFTFSSADYDKLLTLKKEETVSKLKAYENNEDSYIDKVEYDEDFRNLKIYADKQKYQNRGNGNDDITVAATVLSYQIYLGEAQKTNVNVIYTGTEDVVSYYTLPLTMSTDY